MIADRQYIKNLRQLFTAAGALTVALALGAGCDAPPADMPYEPVEESPPEASQWDTPVRQAPGEPVAAPPATEPQAPALPPAEAEPETQAPAF